MALHRPVSFALPLSSSNSLNFPFLSLYSATACLTKVSPNLPQSPFDIKWRLRNRPLLVVLLTAERRATLASVVFWRFSFFLERSEANSTGSCRAQTPRVQFGPKLVLWFALGKIGHTETLWHYRQDISDKAATKTSSSVESPYRSDVIAAYYNIITYDQYSFFSIGKHDGSKGRSQVK